MNDSDFITLLNGVIKVAKPLSYKNSIITSIDQEFKDIGIDSLDCIMIAIYMGDIFGISEELMEAWVTPSVIGLKSFCTTLGTVTDIDVAAVIKDLA